MRMLFAALAVLLRNVRHELLGERDSLGMAARVVERFDLFLDRIDVDLAAIAVPSPGTFESAVVNRDQIERGFLRLEPEMRAVIVLHHYPDLPLPLVADSLGIPLGTAKSRLHRAHAQMRAALEADARAGRGLAQGGPA